MPPGSRRQKDDDAEDDDTSVGDGLKRKWRKGEDDGEKETPAAKTKQEMREQYKAMGNSKAKGKTAKGGTNHWAGFANTD